MNRLVFLPLVLLASPALAHQGDHTHFDWAGLFAHFFETDHIVFAAIAALTGVLAYRAGRRAEAKAMGARMLAKAMGNREARANAKRESRHDPR